MVMTIAGCSTATNDATTIRPGKVSNEIDLLDRHTVTIAALYYLKADRAVGQPERTTADGYGFCKTTVSKWLFSTSRRMDITSC